MSFRNRGLVRLAKFLGRLVLILLGLYAVMFMLFHRGEVEIRRFAEVPSPDNAHMLVIDITNPSTPYGPHKIHISVNDMSDQSIWHEQFPLANDGANLGPRNIDARWTSSDEAEVCLKGEEQTDVLVSIQVSSKESGTRQRKC